MYSQYTVHCATAPKLFLYLMLLHLWLCLAPPLQAQSMPMFRLREQRAYDLFHKALLFYHAQRYEAAREFFYQALSVQPYFHLARLYLGDAYYYTGDWANALEQWEFLDQNLKGGYPLAKERSAILRLRLAPPKAVPSYVLWQSYGPKAWPGFSFLRPSALAIDQSSYVYLASYGSNNVLRISPSGNALQEYSGSFFNPLESPLCLGVNAKGELYVCDYKQDRIHVYSARGKKLFHFGSSGKAAGRFHGPGGIAIRDELVFVSDIGNRRVQKFDLKGAFLLDLHKEQKGPLLRYPAGLLIDKRDSLYVADRDAGHIYHYDWDGNYLGSIQSSYLARPRSLTLQDKHLIIADERKGLVLYHLENKTWSQMKGLRSKQNKSLHFVRPFAVQADPAGALYVGDYGAKRLYVLAPLGMRISNLDCRIQKVDIRAFPEVALFISAQNRVGHPIQGLSKRSFVLTENDSRIKFVKVDNTKPYNRRLAWALVKEHSPFMHKRYAGYFPKTLEASLASLRITDTMYLLRADDDPRLVYKGLAAHRIRKIMQNKQNLSSAPNLGKALYMALSHLNKRLGARALVLLVSGKQYPKAFSTYSLARIRQYAKSHSIAIYVLSYEGAGDKEVRQKMRRLYQSLALQSQGEYFHALNNKALADLYTRMQNKKDERYVLSYRTELGSKFKGRYIDLRLRLQHLGTQGLCNAAYFVP